MVSDYDVLQMKLGGAGASKKVAALLMG
jgi:hypothetical protein